MSHSFTIVPHGDFEAAAAAVSRRARLSSCAKADIAESPGDVELFFTGDPNAAARYDGERDAFGCLRILRSSGVFQVDAEGYEGSVDQLDWFVRWILSAFAPCRVFDDETGEDLGPVISRAPIALFGADPELEEEAEV